MFAEVKLKLEQAKRALYTTNMCTKGSSNNVFIILTIHLIEQITLEQSNFNLFTRPIQQQHTGANISEVIAEIFSDWKLIEKSHNVANMISGLNAIQMTHIIRLH